MARKLPKWFWFSLIVFCAGQWIAIPILGNFVTSARDVVLGVLIITFVIYPIFYVTIIAILRKKEKLTKEVLIVAGIFLLLPLLLYVPIFAEL